MSTTVVACFDDRTEAVAVERELIESGIDRDDVHMTAQRAGTTSVRREEPGMWESIKEAFGFADESDRSTYAEAARRGGVIVSVDTADAAANRVAEIMRRHHAVDLDQRRAQWRNEGWTGYAAGTQSTQQSTAAQQQHRQQAQRPKEGGEVIPVVEEQVRVGKRATQTGGVRVYSHVTEQPVEERVNLREEHVKVERRPANRPISDADRAFRERSIEATETAEEPVVAKEARVVEEVVLKKDVDQRTATVRDKVRHTDVDVEQLPGQRSGNASMTSYDDFTTALASDERYRGRDWNAIESDARTSFQQRYPQARWDDSRDAIREGYERMRLRNRSAR